MLIIQKKMDKKTHKINKLENFKIVKIHIIILKSNNQIKENL